MFSRDATKDLCEEGSGRHQSPISQDLAQLLDMKPLSTTYDSLKETIESLEDDILKTKNACIETEQQLHNKDNDEESKNALIHQLQKHRLNYARLHVNRKTLLQKHVSSYACSDLSLTTHRDQDIFTNHTKISTAVRPNSSDISRMDKPTSACYTEQLRHCDTLESALSFFQSSMSDSKSQTSSEDKSSSFDYLEETNVSTKVDEIILLGSQVDGPSANATVERKERIVDQRNIVDQQVRFVHTHAKFYRLETILNLSEVGSLTDFGGLKVCKDVVNMAAAKSFGNSDECYSMNTHQKANEIGILKSIKTNSRTETSENEAVYTVTEVDTLRELPAHIFEHSEEEIHKNVTIVEIELERVKDMLDAIRKIIHSSTSDQQSNSIAIPENKSPAAAQEQTSQCLEIDFSSESESTANDHKVMEVEPKYRSKTEDKITTPTERPKITAQVDMDLFYQDFIASSWAENHYPLYDCGFDSRIESRKPRLSICPANDNERLLRDIRDATRLLGKRDVLDKQDLIQERMQFQHQRQPSFPEYWHPSPVVMKNLNAMTPLSPTSTHFHMLEQYLQDHNWIMPYFLLPKEHELLGYCAWPLRERVIPSFLEATSEILMKSSRTATEKVAVMQRLEKGEARTGLQRTFSKASEEVLSPHIVSGESYTVTEFQFMDANVRHITAVKDGGCYADDLETEIDSEENALTEWEDDSTALKDTFELWSPPIKEKSSLAEKLKYITIRSATPKRKSTSRYPEIISTSFITGENEKPLEQEYEFPIESLKSPTEKHESHTNLPEVTFNPREARFVIFRRSKRAQKHLSSHKNPENNTGKENENQSPMKTMQRFDLQKTQAHLARLKPTARITKLPPPIDHRTEIAIELAGVLAKRLKRLEDIEREKL